MKSKSFDKIEWLLLGILILTLVWSFGINYHVSRHVLDDDAASEMMLAEVLHREKSLYSEDFYYSTEYFVQNQLVFGFLFHFFDGWANVRFLGTSIIQLLYLASFLFMMSQSGIGRKGALGGAVLLMLPFTVVYGRTILYHCYYVSNFIFEFLLMGLFFSFFRHPQASKGSVCFRAALLLIVSGLSCFLYVRQIILVMIPMMICLFFFLLASSGAQPHPYRKWMLLPAAVLAAGALGMLLNTRLLIPSLDLYEQAEQNLGVLSPAAWGPIIAAFFTQFGFRTGVKIFSPVGILSLGGFFCALVWGYRSIRDLFRTDIPDFREYLLRTMLPAGLGLNLLIFIFGEIPFRLQSDYSRYLALASVWIVPMICCQWKQKESFPHIKRIITLLCTALFVMNALFNGVSFLRSGSFGQPYDGISYDDPRLADDLQAPIEFIRSQNYSCGYAMAGHANTLVELMNGFPVVSLRKTPDGAWEYANWLTLKSYKTIDAERAFLLMTAADAEIYAEALEKAGAEKLYFDDRGYVVYDIPDPLRFRELIREPDRG